MSDNANAGTATATEVPDTRTWIEILADLTADDAPEDGRTLDQIIADHANAHAAHIAESEAENETAPKWNDFEYTLAHLIDGCHDELAQWVRFHIERAEGRGLQAGHGLNALHELASVVERWGTTLASEEDDAINAGRREVFDAMCAARGAAWDDVRAYREGDARREPREHQAVELETSPLDRWCGAIKAADQHRRMARDGFEDAGKLTFLLLHYIAFRGPEMVRHVR